MQIGGVITAMVTPFSDDGAVDEAGARRLAAHLVENGSHGLVVSGTTGESPTLDDSEKLALLRAVQDEVGDRATVICGTGSNDTRHSIELTKAAADAGADAALVVTPYYNKPNRAGVLAHVEAIAGAVDLPILLYNIPSRCVINLPPDLLAELALIDNVVGVKQANNEELEAIDGMDVLAGNDEIFLRCLEIGGTGGILVASHIVGPRMREMYDAFEAGDTDRAHGVEDSLRDVFEALTVTANPIPVKAALAMIGLIGPTLRLPMVEADEEQAAAVREMLERHDLLTAGART
jgi:4-hydroxy-tetrahydrodipicolinate synthase